MSRPNKINLEEREIKVLYANWLKQMIDMVSPKNLYLLGGRALGKTSDVIADRAQDIVYDMPGAPFAFVGDTYINLMTNIIPSFLEGWHRMGWYEDIHYISDKKPEMKWRRKHYRPVISYKHTLSLFNGCTFHLVSMDRPTSGAGASYLHLFGDEARYLKFEKLKKLMPAVRGDYIRFGHSVYYRGHTFTSDLPNPLENDDPWIFDMVKRMDKQQILTALDAAIVLNEIRQEYYHALKSKEKQIIENTRKKMQRWEERWKKIRKNSTFYYVASSFVNAAILTPEWFDEQLEALGETEFAIAVLSIKAGLEKGAMFYGNLNESHFYSDGYNYDYYDQFGLRDNITQNARGLKHIRKDEKLEAGVDFGNMMSMVIGQEQWPNYRVLKGMHVLSPEWINNLADNFVEFFRPQKHKVLDLYYDRSANQYRKQRQDFATKLKNYIENSLDPSGKRRPTGWKVNLMSVGQGDIRMSEEYDFMGELMAEKNKSLPKLLIDKFECKELKSSLEMAPLAKNTKREIIKVKKSEKLPVKRLPMESTNFSDAFKYLMMRKKYMEVVRARRIPSIGDTKLR